MPPESCSKVLGAAGKPRHLCDNRHPINQGHVFLLFHFELMPFFYKYVMPRCIHFELMPSSINMLHVFLYCLQCSLSHAYFGNARGEGDATREKRCRRNSSFSGLGCMSPNNNTTTPLLSTLGQQQQTARAVPL